MSIKFHNIWLVVGDEVGTDPDYQENRDYIEGPKSCFSLFECMNPSFSQFIHGSLQGGKIEPGVDYGIYEITDNISNNYEKCNDDNISHNDRIISG